MTPPGVPTPAPSVPKPSGQGRLGQWLGGAAGLVVLGLALWALSHIAGDTSWSQVRASIHDTPTLMLLLAAGCAAASYVVLIAYDWLAVRHLKYVVPLKTVALASFTSFTMSHTLGLTVLTGGTVRYRIYTRAGVKPLDVALIVLLCGWTFWLGIIAVAGLGLVISPDLATPFRHVATMAIRWFTGDRTAATYGDFALVVERWAGVLLLAATAAYTLLATLYRKPIRWKAIDFTLPDGRETLLQIVVGAVDLAFAALVIYVLLPVEGRPGVLSFFVIYAVAMVVGALSHSPGGLGVFELVIVKLLPESPKPEVLAALVLFRLIYTLIPFLIGLVMLGATEFAAFRQRRRELPAPAAAPPEPAIAALGPTSSPIPSAPSRP